MNNLEILVDNTAQILIKVAVVIACLIVVLLLLKILSKVGKISDVPLTKNKKVKIADGSLDHSKLDNGNNPNGFIFGIRKNLWEKEKVYLDCKNEGHIFVFGGSGSGKTSALLIPSLKTWLGTFFVIDISGDIESNVDCENKVIINPDDPENSVVYDVLNFVSAAKDEQQKKERIDALVNLIVDKPTGITSDATNYYLETARTILRASITAFYGQQMDFCQICEKVFFNSYDKLFEEIEKTGNEKAAAYVQSLKGSNEKNISGAKDELNKKIRMFADDENVQAIVHRPAYLGEAPDGTDIIEEFFAPEIIEQKRVFLVIPDIKTEYYSTFMRVVTGQILDYLAARPFNKNSDTRILLALDEFASLGHVNIREPLEKDRKRGVNICILTQSLAHLDLLYSQAERKIILDNCQYIAILGANENDTRRYFSELVGKKEVIKTSVSRGRGGKSISESNQKEYIIDPENWNKLGDELILVHPGGYCKLEKNYYFKN